MEAIKVLLVDDEEDFVTTLSDRIRKRRLESETAMNGEQALELVVNQLPDVMVLDLKMPGIDGMEVLRQIKMTHPEVQVIILTGHGSADEQMKARLLGAYAYLEKPVNIDVLVQSIKAAYQNKMKLY